VGLRRLVDDLGAKRRIWGSGRLSYDPVAFFGSPDAPGLALVRVTPVRASVQTIGEHGPTVLRWRR